MQLALTCDDAPRMAGASMTGPAHARPAPLEEFAGVLDRHGVNDCVAFVIGHLAEAEEPALRRWLELGYELGNHSFDHESATRMGPERFMDSVRRCDDVLESVGAFEGNRQRWFRFPYLDRGEDAGERRAIAEGLGELGYRIVPASIDLFDHAYESVLVDALVASDTERANTIGERFLSVALAATLRAEALTTGYYGQAAVQLPYFHIGAVASLHLDALLTRLRGVEWCPVDKALDHPMFGAYADDFECNGLVTNAVIPRGGLERLTARVVRELANLGITGDRELGPRWPHLA